MDSLVERKDNLRGYIVGNSDRTKWRAWINGMPTWVDDPTEATRYGFRSDANAVHAEDEDAWCVVKYEDVATPAARITGDKDRGSPVEGAPYGEGLIGRITELERQLKVAREALEKIQAGDYPRPLGKPWRMDATSSKHDRCIHDAWMYETCEGCLDAFVNQALANMEQADG